MRVCAVLDQEDVPFAAELCDRVGFEGEVTADVREEGGTRTMTLRLLLEVGKGHAQVLPVAVHELDFAACSEDRERPCHERVGRAEDRCPLHARVLERGQRGTGPAREGDGVEAVPFRPGGLEGLYELAFGPLLLIQGPIPEVVKPSSITMIEPDGELVRGRHGVPGRQWTRNLLPRAAVVR